MLIRANDVRGMERLLDGLTAKWAARGSMPSGWGLFNLPRGDIQRDDEAAVFLTDEDAVLHVAQLAGKGDFDAALALSIRTIAELLDLAECGNE